MARIAEPTEAAPNPTKAPDKRVGRGGVGPALVRALQLARAQVPDDLIAKVLRAEYATTEPYKILRSHLEEHLEKWAEMGLLADARAAGSVYVQETLYRAATEGKETGAAIHIQKHQVQLEGLDLSVRRELERILKLEGADLEREMERLRAGLAGDG